MMKHDNMTMREAKVVQWNLIINQKTSFRSQGLKELPSLIPESPLTKLRASYCDLQSLPDNLFHYQLEEVEVCKNKGELKGSG